MNKRDLKPIFEQLRPSFGDLAIHKRLLLVKPLGQVVRGITFEPSAFSREPFSLRAFLMPLCVPTDHFHLTFGINVHPSGPSGGWSLNMPDLVPKLEQAIAEQAMPFLASSPSLRDFVDAVRPFSLNPHGPKEAAYALAHVGETKQAIALIEDYLPKLDLSSHWQKQIDEDSRALRHLLIYEPALAAGKLEEWENETIRNLGLERFR